MAVAIDGKGEAAHWISLAAIIVVAAWLRVVAIDTQSLWTDESLTIVLSNWSIGDMLLKPTDPTPFLYYALHKLLLPPNASIIAIRSISVVAGILSVGLMYVLGRLAYGRAGGLLAAALLAVWRIHVDYSQEARAYSLLFLFTLLTSVGFLYYARILSLQPVGREKMRSGQGKYALAIFGIGNVLGFYTHVVSIFWIALTSLMLIALVARQRRRRMTEVAVLFAVMALCALPGLVWLAGQRIGREFSWVQQRGLAELVRMCMDIFLPLGFWDATATHTFGGANILKAIVVSGFVVGLGVGCWTGRRRILVWLRARSPVLWLTLAYFLVPVIIWLQGFVGQPILISRVLLYCVPGMILLITGICLAQEKRAAVWAGLAVVLLYGASIPLIGTIREREDWRGAYEYLSRAIAPGDVIAICPAYNFPSLRYHATAPIDATVVTILDGKLAEIEKKLGSDSNWDRTYFRNLVFPQTTARMEGGDVSLGDLGIARKLELKPGQSIWRVDGHCGEVSDDMDRALSVVGPGPGIMRFQKDARRAYAVSIRQYLVVAPLTLDIPSFAAQQ